MMLTSCINEHILSSLGGACLDSEQVRFRFRNSTFGRKLMRTKIGAHVTRIRLPRPAGRRFALVAGLLAVGAAPLFAQTGGSPPGASRNDAERAGGPAGALGTVVVTATRSPAEALGVPASVSVVDRPALGLRSPTRLGDALADVPGLYVRGAAMGAVYPGSGQAVLSLRGVPRTPRTLVMIDGQPVNNALSGGINVAGIPLGSVDQVEVVRGPYSALYGGAAMGGVVNFLTGSADEPLTELRAGFGNQGQRGTALLHRKRYEGGLGVVFSLGYRESDGDPDSSYVVKALPRGGGGTAVPVTGVRPSFDPNGSPRYWVGTQGARPWAQGNANLKLDYAPSTSTRFTAGLGWADYSVGYSRPNSFLRDAAGQPVFTGQVAFDDAGVARRLSMASTDWLTATPAGERDSRMYFRAEHRLDGGSQLSAQIGVQRNNLFFSQGASGAATYEGGPGNLTDQPNRRIDAELSLRTPMSDSWILSSGLSINRSRLDRQITALDAWRNDDSSTARLAADGGRSNNVAAFLQSEHFLADDLTFYVGGRYDRFETDGFAFQQSGPPIDERYPKRSFSQFSPKLALVWQAKPGLSLRASYGHGFRPPSLFDMYGLTVIGIGASTLVYEPSPALEPERIRAFELGADMAFAGGGRASVTLYRQQLLDLIYRSGLPTSTPTVTRTRAANVGEADIDGVEASLRLPTGWRGLNVFGAYTHHFRAEISRNDGTPGMVGKRLTDVPRTAWSAGIDYQSGRLSGLLVARHTGHVFPSGDDLNLDTVEGVFGAYDAHTVLSARLGWRFNRHWAASLSVDNLTDRVYFVSNRQPGRTVYAEIAYRF
jgi:iron complex outermembrane receptor protein